MARVFSGIETQANNLISTAPKLDQAQIDSFIKPKLDQLFTQKTASLFSLEKLQKNLIFFQNSLPTPEKLDKMIQNIAKTGSELDPHSQKEIISMLVEKIEISPDESQCYINFDETKKSPSERGSGEDHQAYQREPKKNPRVIILWNTKSCFPFKRCHSIKNSLS